MDSAQGGLLDELAAECTGYCGADLKALCAEAALTAVQRRYPQIYQSDKKLRIDESTVVVARDDFVLARRKIVPSLHRSSKNYARSLSTVLEPLLRPAAAAIVRPERSFSTRRLWLACCSPSSYVPTWQVVTEDSA